MNEKVNSLKERAETAIKQLLEEGYIETAVIMVPLLKDLVRQLIAYEKEEAEQKPVRWKPKDGEGYFYVTDYGVVEQDTWSVKFLIHRHRWGNNNVYKEYSEAVKFGKLSNLKAKFKLLAEESEASVGGFDWGDNNQNKWHCYIYNTLLKAAPEVCIKDMGQVYFASKEDLQEAIEEIGKENLIEIIKRGV